MKLSGQGSDEDLGEPGRVENMIKICCMKFFFNKVNREAVT